MRMISTGTSTTRFRPNADGGVWAKVQDAPTPSVDQDADDDVRRLIITQQARRIKELEQEIRELRDRLHA